MTEPLLLVRRGAVAIISNNDAPYNRMTLEFMDRLEEVIDELDEITKIKTEISNGLAVLQVEADFGIDYDEKYDEILAAVTSIRASLPAGIFDIEVTQFKPEDRVVVQQFAFVSDSVPYKDLHDLAEAFQDQIEKIDFRYNWLSNGRSY